MRLVVYLVCKMAVYWVGCWVCLLVELMVAVLADKWVEWKGGKRAVAMVVQLEKKMAVWKAVLLVVKMAEMLAVEKVE